MLFISTSLRRFLHVWMFAAATAAAAASAIVVVVVIVVVVKSLKERSGELSLL